jgi:hypothetical protein
VVLTSISPTRSRKLLCPPNSLEGSKMAKMVKKNAAITFVSDDSVSEPGYYVLEGEPEESIVAITTGDQVYDSEGKPVVLENGRMAVANCGPTGELITVKHESNMVPGPRVYPLNNWFSYDNPEGGEN